MLQAPRAGGPASLQRLTARRGGGGGGSAAAHMEAGAAAPHLAAQPEPHSPALILPCSCPEPQCQHVEPGTWRARREGRRSPPPQLKLCAQPIGAAGLREVRQRPRPALCFRASGPAEHALWAGPSGAEAPPPRPSSSPGTSSDSGGCLRPAKGAPAGLAPSAPAIRLWAL